MSETETTRHDARRRLVPFLIAALTTFALAACDPGDPATDPGAAPPATTDPVAPAAPADPVDPAAPADPAIPAN